jgi:hypothetical protein
MITDVRMCALAIESNAATPVENVLASPCGGVAEWSSRPPPVQTIPGSHPARVQGFQVLAVLLSKRNKQFHCVCRNLRKKAPKCLHRVPLC